MKRVGADYDEVLYIRVKSAELESFRHGARLEGEPNLSQWARDALQRSAREAATEMLAEAEVA